VESKQSPSRNLRPGSVLRWLSTQRDVGRRSYAKSPGVSDQLRKRPAAPLSANFGRRRSLDKVPVDTCEGMGEVRFANMTLSNYPYFYPDTEVLVYTGSGDSGWEPMPFGALPRELEFLFDGRFYHVDAEGWVRVNTTVEVDAAKLAEAARPFEPYNWRWPEPGDVARFVDQGNRHLRHDRAGACRDVERFWFQGVLYECFAKPDSPTGYAYQATEFVLADDGRVMSVEEFAVARGDSQDEVHGSQASSVVEDGAGRDRQPGNACIVLASFSKSHDLPNGVVLSRNENSVAQSGADSGGMPTEFGFAGHRYDSSTGLIYMGARYYDPKLGRFISPDPTVPEPGNPQSLNRYSYVENNPVTFIDPYGLEKVIIVYGSYPNTNSFMAAAETQYQMALNAGYVEGDILLMAVSTDADVFAAIAGSDKGEIEHVYMFSHGWPEGLQLKTGPDVGYEDAEYQLTSEDLDPGLRDRFSSFAEFHINACNVGAGSFAQDIADTYGATVYAYEQSLKFWKLQQVPLEYPQMVPYYGEGDYDPDVHVEMMPYWLGAVTFRGNLIVDLSIVRPVDPVKFAPWPFRGMDHFWDGDESDWFFP